MIARASVDELFGRGDLHDARVRGVALRGEPAAVAVHGPQAFAAPGQEVLDEAQRDLQVRAVLAALLTGQEGRQEIVDQVAEIGQEPHIVARADVDHASLQAPGTSSRHEK
ncbi:hypothetical protein [Nonomuraea sp. NPDC005650]|uniref:hypothetical protein n=1 Tax=Nonomuraea sp. NPDC005650 TaxID=3157045 RepID=UPI00339E3788